MATSNARYFIFSKNSFNRTGVAKALKNAETREDARNYKRNQSNPTAYGIMDRFTGEAVR